MTDKRNGETVGAEGLREAIAAFLKDRDEAFIMSDEQTDEERLESADEIMQLVAALASPARAGTVEPLPLCRSLDQYANCTPEAVSGGSAAQMLYFVRDVKRDIATLATMLAAAASHSNPANAEQAKPDGEVERRHDLADKIAAGVMGLSELRGFSDHMAAEVHGDVQKIVLAALAFQPEGRDQ